MSLTLENNRIDQISCNGFLRRSKMPPFNPLILDLRDRTLVEERENGSAEPCSSSSSSIGKNSDDEEEEEVESKLKNTPLDSAVDTLEQALPIRRGISNFYNGKSKSFASLSDTACSPIKDVAKPENTYTRKRKNLLAYTLLYDKTRTSSSIKGPGIGGGIAKRPIHASRRTLALAVAMSNCESQIEENGSSPETNWSNNSRTSSQLPPASPHRPPTPWRSFSLADLQHCGSAVNSNLSSPLMGKGTKPDEVS